MKIINKLPDFFNTERGDDIPQDIIGSEILNFGTGEDGNPEGSGLVIEYRTKEGACKRVGFSFNELCMWISSEEDI